MKRVVVTGMGAITPLGNTVADFWQGLVDGRSGVRLATRYDIADFPYVVAAEVEGFDPREYMDAKAARRMARFAQFAVNVLNVPNHFDDPERTALDGIVAMEDFFRSIGMPTSLKDMNIVLTQEQIKELAYKCSFMGKRTIGASKTLAIPDIEAIYRMAK